MAKILVVDDDRQITETLKKWLQAEGHVVEVSENGLDALQLMLNFAYELILLDWTLPGLSGMEVCKRYRANGGIVAIIFVTGRSDLDDRELGLDLGGDDYVCKPFELREVSARIRSLLRRPKGLLPQEIAIDDVSLSVQDNVLKVGDVSLKLMPKEAALLEYLMRHPNRLFGSKELLNAVWPSDSETTSVTVRSWMRNLRAKLAGAGKVDFIKTISGLGYVIEYGKHYIAISITYEEIQATGTKRTYFNSSAAYL